MINLIYGPKGSGKTGKIMDAVNNACKTSSGSVLFITDNARSLDIDRNVRFVNVNDYDVKWDCCLAAFIKGMVAANSDNLEIYIDGATRILGKSAEQLEEFMTELENLSTRLGINITLTVSTGEKLPKFMLKYV